MEYVVVVFSNEAAQHRVARMLESEGWRGVCCCHTGADAIRTVRKLGAAAVICGFKLRDMTATELAASVRGAAALLVMASPVNLSFCEGENLLKLATPASRTDFFASLDLLRRVRPPVRPQSIRREDDLRAIRRAKELLMDRNRMTEQEAHRFLQKHSMDAGARLEETARRIIESYGP